MASAKEFLAKHGLAIGTPSTIVFNSSGVLQAAALSGASFAITSVDLDGGTDIGADLADADLFLVDDGAGGTNRKSALSRVKKYIYSAVSGDATVSDTGALTIASGSVENAMLAGSIANSKLTNSTVSFGGVSLALGASDATPAFDLSDATNYPTSSLSGTITNAQLAGSIANSKLTNSTITVSDGSNSTATALGGTITFSGTSGEVDVAESSGTVTIGLPNDVTIGNDLVVTGDLTVSGTTTTINSNTLNIGDNIITLNSDVTGSPTQNAGIEVERGTGNNVQLRWNETTDKWQFTNDGSSFSDLGAGLTIQEEGSALSTAAQTLNFVGAAVTATGSGTTKTITISGGDIVNDTTPQLGGDLDLNGNSITGSGHIDIGDDNRLKLGASDDLQIYHDGSHSYIDESGTGYLILKSSEIQIQSDGGEDMAKFEPNGAVRLYHDNVEKITTTSGGVTVAGNIVVSGTVDGVDVAALNTSVSGKLTNIVEDTSPQLGGNLDTNSNHILFADNYEARFGNSDDLTLAHISGNSEIRNRTGELQIRADTIKLKNNDNNETYLSGVKDGAVELYHNNIKKLETTSTGATVTGAVLATTAQIGGTDGVAVSQGAISIKNGGSQSYIDFYCESSNAHYARLLAPAHADFSGNITITLPSEDDTLVGRATTDTLTNKTLTSPNITTPSISDPSITGKADIATVQLDTLAVENPASHHTYTVTVASKTSAHPYTGQGSSNAYFLDGKEAPSIVLAPNMTYRFDQSSNTNSGHPLAFYLDAAKNTSYTTGVTTNGTAGSSGAYTQIVVTDATPPVLYYQCTAHAYMGSVSSSLTNGRLSDISDVNTATPTDGQALVWDNSNSYWTPGTVGGALTIQDEGSSLSTAGTTLNFVGAGVTASGTGATKTITISGGGGGSSLTVQDEGSALSTAATTLNFVGAGVTASGTGATKTITISGGGGGGSSLSVKDEGSALSTAATTLNFVGAGVTASGTGAEKTITIAGGGAGGTTPLGGAFQVGTGNGSTTTFTSPLNTNIANNLIVSVDGIMQRPTTDYTVSGTTVTFGTAPPAGTAVMVRSFQGAMSTKSDFTVQNFTANGSNTVYKLVEGVTSGDHVLVSINGIIQRNGTDYTYSTATGNITFDAAPTSGDIISFRTFDVQQSTSATVSDTAPSNPRNGDFWFDSSTAKLYMRYEDGSSNQWVSLSVAGAAGADGADGTPTVYANTSVLPSSGNTVGDLAFATLTKSLHVWDGSEWDRINSGGDENPRLTTTPASAIALNGDGTNTAITIAASDPEGFPITYSYDTNPANPNQITNVVENNGVFTLVPSTNSAHAGNFTLRLKASDGVHITSHAIAMSLSFQTNFTFDTSLSTINSTYTTTNKVNVTVGASSTATSEQTAKMGKGYMEFKIIQDATYLFIGVGSGTYNATYSGTGSMMIYYDGVLYPGPVSTGLGANNVDDIIMVAYDTTAEKVWFGMNGTWGTNMNPATDAGITVGGDPSTNGFRPIFNGGSSSASTFRVEIISHTQGAQYTIPTGWALA